MPAERARHLREDQQQRVPEQVATIIRRVSGTLAPTWLSAIEPISAPPAKLATR